MTGVLHSPYNKLQHPNKTTMDQSILWAKSRKEMNKDEHMKNGNKEKGMKISHWNMGNTHLPNKMREIERIIQQERPSILGISEANMKENQDLEKVTVQGYKLFTCKHNENSTGIKRLVVYAKEGLNIRIREDLMDESFCSIWLEVMTKTSTFLVCQVYREHKQMGLDGSDGRESQWTRWAIFLDQWLKAIEEQEEVHVLGDMNWNWNSLDKNQGTINTAIAESTKELILVEGVTQCIRQNTRYPQGNQNHEPNLVDHFYTTSPDKLKIQVKELGYSDHNMISGERMARGGDDMPKYTQKRTYKNLDNEDYLKELEKKEWLGIYLEEEDVDKAVKIFTDNITSILDRKDMAPVRSIQNRRNYCPWISDDTKDLMRQRDEAVKKNNENKTTENEIEA